MIKVTKLEELEDAKHPHNINVGFEKQFNVKEIPTVEIGCKFVIGDKTRYFHSSYVQEVIEENDELLIFKTLNSIYKVKKV